MTQRRPLGTSLLLALAAACSEPAKHPTETAAPQVARITKPPAPVPGVDSVAVRRVAANQLPALLPSPLPGTVLEARQWRDAAGENLLVVSRRGPQPEQSPADTDEAYAELFARQYVQRAGRWQQLWQLQDAVRNCAFDLGLGPLPGATTITDLDHDGHTETTLIYQLACRSDVSPARLKLVLREGTAKYALRGYTVVPYDSVPATRRAPANPCCLDTLSKTQLAAPNGYQLYAGRYESEQEFRAAPPAFLRFARQQWRRWSVRDEFEQL